MADATVAAVPVPIRDAHELGILSCDERGRVERFDEKPQFPAAMAGNPTEAYASMGNYLFRPEVLRQVLLEAQQRHEHDFGRHVVPRLLQRRQLYAYDFTGAQVPGMQLHEQSVY